MFPSSSDWQCTCMCIWCKCIAALPWGARERSWKWKWKLLPRSNVPCRFFRPATPQPKRKRLRLMYQSDKARADDGWKLGEGWRNTRSFRVGCFQMVVLVKNPPEISLTTKMSNILRSSSSLDHEGVGVYAPWISKLSIDCQWSTSRKSQRSRGNYCGGSCWVMLSGFLGGRSNLQQIRYCVIWKWHEAYLH